MKCIAPSLSLVIVMVSLGCGGSDPDTAATEFDTGAAAVADSGADDIFAVDDSSMVGDDATPTVDTDGTTSDGGMTTTDGSTGGGKIACGMDACTPATQDCCVSGGMGGASSTCVPNGTCMGGATLKCTDPSACAAGQVCCARFTGGMSGATCSTTCMGGFRLCTSDAHCNKGEICSMGLGGTKYCRTAGTGTDGGFPGFDGGSFFDTGMGGG